MAAHCQCLAGHIARRDARSRWALPHARGTQVSTLATNRRQAARKSPRVSPTPAGPAATIKANLAHDRCVHATVSFMNPRHLLAAALQLSAEERAALAGQLIESLDQQVDDDAEAAWSVEIQRRLQRLDDGIASTVPWPEARRRILAAVDSDAGT